MKVIKIESCEKCPYRQWNSYYEEWVCMRDFFQTATPDEGIAYFCPLPDEGR